LETLEIRFDEAHPYSTKEEKHKMNTDRKTAMIVGILYIVGTVTGVLSVAFAKPILDAQNYLVRVSANGSQIVVGALFVLIMGFALAMVPVLMFPILKKQNEGLALGYVVFRGGLETLTYIAAAVSWLLLPTLGLEFVKAGTPGASYFQTLGTLLLGAADRSSLMTTFAFGLGALMFYSLLFQTKLIPRWISIWGLIAILMHLTTGLLLLFRLTTEFSTLDTVMNFPIAVQEMVMAVWLIAKGFNPAAIVALFPSPGRASLEPG
jgi:hypothetical protein